MAVDTGKFPVRIETMAHRAPNVEIFFPQVTGLANRDAQVRINRTIAEQTRELVRRQMAVQIQGNTEMQGYYEIKSNERGVLSLIQVNYAYTPPMAHGMTFAGSLTFSVATGRSYGLGDLFKPGSPYVARISANIREQIQQRDFPTLGEFTAIRPDQDYYIADKALVVYFQLYEIAPYAAGFPMFPISVYTLQDIIAENSPLGVMLADV
jgi:hypothetical protein